MKERLDKVIKERRLIRCRSRAQRMIEAGRVRVDGRVVTRPGHPVDTEATIEIVSQEPYVSREGRSSQEPSPIFASIQWTSSASISGAPPVGLPTVS